MNLRQHRRRRHQMQRRVSRRGGPFSIRAATARMLKRLMAPRTVPFFAKARAKPIPSQWSDSYTVRARPTPLVLRAL